MEQIELVYLLMRLESKQQSDSEGKKEGKQEAKGGEVVSFCGMC